MQRRTQTSRPKSKLSQFVISQDSEGWMNASFSGTDGNSRLADYLSAPLAAGNGAPRLDFNSSRQIARRTGGITISSPLSVRQEPARRYSVPYIGYQGHDENQRPVVAGPQRTEVVSGTHHSNSNSLLQQSRNVSHSTVSKPVTYTGTPLRHGRPMQADLPHQPNPARLFHGPQRRPFVPLDNILEEILPNGGGFPSLYVPPYTGLQGVDTSMTPISGSPHDRTQNDASPADEIDENVERIMRALQYHSNELPGDNHRGSRLFQLLSVAIPYRPMVMPRPKSLDNTLTDKVAIQIPPAATEIMDQGDDKMDELGRTLLDHLLSFACTTSIFTKIVLQVLRQTETRYGPHAETQLRSSLAAILMTAFRQYFVGEGSILSDRLSITLAEAVGGFFVSGLLHGQDFFLALDTLLAPSAHNRIAAMGAVFGCCNDVTFPPAHVELFQAFCAKLTQQVNGVYVHGEGTKNGQAIIMVRYSMLIQALF
ncbi:hypothetical protein IW261DRAFT_863052 [Armillaria novae-zelandiae]|uniref:Uncharacterized protein n=1 Tax=Armillaria novae-zelandiae TaxID=153914 RepID=A0AA39PIG0_9AGAR|nr:hypothetical protein IW261DRAFT_863052 [Armillaria novae-zelandiae]